MTSQKKIDANRTNAKKSTGPKTASGKARTRHNAVTHGNFSVSPRLIRHEDFEAYANLAQRLLDDLDPRSAIEDMLVDQILGDMWRLRRLELAEQAYLEQMGESPADKIARASGLMPTPIRRTPIPEEPTEGPITDAKMREYLIRRSEDSSNDPTLKQRQDFRIRTVLLRGLLPGDPAIAYSTLERMRRSLVRDIMKAYASLAEIQGKDLTMASREVE